MEKKSFSLLKSEMWKYQRQKINFTDCAVLYVVMLDSNSRPNKKTVNNVLPYVKSYLVTDACISESSDYMVLYKLFYLRTYLLTCGWSVNSTTCQRAFVF